MSTVSSTNFDLNIRHDIHTAQYQTDNQHGRGHVCHTNWKDANGEQNASSTPTLYTSPLPLAEEQGSITFFLCSKTARADG